MKIKTEILLPLDFSDADKCIECIKGKHVKSIKGAVRATRVLEVELIHTDISGPLYIYRISDQSEALDKVKVFKVEVENQLNEKIRVVRATPIS